MPDLLYAAPSGGSMIVEAVYALAEAPLEVHDLAWDADWAASPLAAVNPLLQVPTLVLEDGVVMTESAAIALFLAERHPNAGLAPAPGSPQRAAFLRWLVYFPGAIYPPYTFGDIPTRFVEGDEACGEKLARAALERLKQAYLGYEAAAVGPWFLGADFSAIDLCVWAATHWRPRRAWYEAHTPKLWAIGKRVDGLPSLAEVARRNPREPQE